MSDSPTPLPLVREAEPATPFPVQALGKIAADLVDQMAEIIQAPAALIAQSVLSAMNLVAQPHANVVLDGRVCPLSLFLLTLGESGERKSAADGWVLTQVRKRQREQMQRYRMDYELYERAITSYDATIKRIVNNKKYTPEQREQLLSEVEKPKSPVMPLYLVSEPSAEAIHRQLMQGLPAVGLINDEGGQFLGGYAMSQDKRLGTLTTLSRLWDRGEFDRVRVGDGAGSYFGRRLNLHLMLQPMIAASLLADPLAREQGFLSRCLVSYPTSTAGQRFYADLDLSMTRAYAAFDARVAELLDMPWPLNDHGELEPQALELSLDAKAEWVQIYDEIEKRLGAGQVFAPVRPLASKSGEHVLRLAGTFAVFEGARAVSQDHVTRAGDLIDHYLFEAKRLWGAGAVAPELKLAADALAWIQQKYGVGSVFTLADVYRNGPAAIRNAARARQVTGILLAHHWLCKAEHPKAGEAFELVAG